MRYEWLISLRYLMSKRRSQLSLITVISIFGVHLGVAALIIVLSVMGGFANDLREKIVGTKAHMVIEADHGSLEHPDVLLPILRAVPDVVGASSYVQSEVMISARNATDGIVLRGIDPEQVRNTSNLAESLLSGDLRWLYEPEHAILDGVPPDLYEGRVRGEGASALGAGDCSDTTRMSLEELMACADGLAESSRELAREVEALQALAEQGGSGSPLVEMPVGPQVGRDSDTAEGTGMSDGTGITLDGSGSALTQGDTPTGADEGSGDLAQEATPSGFVMQPIPVGPSEPRRIPGIIIGAELAERLFVEIGDEITIITPDGDLLVTGPVPAARPFVVVGTFFSGLYEFDMRFAYTLISDAQDLFNLERHEVTAIDIKVRDLDQVHDVQRNVELALGEAGRTGVLVRSWEELNKGLFSALKLEKIVIFIILSIIILVASFSIVSSLVIMVVERASEIAILKSMGATRTSIIGVFAIEGGLIGLIGTFLGTVVGVFGALLIGEIGVPLDTRVYYIETLPVALNASEVIFTALAALVISLLATVYPALKAARLNPAEALRYD